MDSVKIDEHGIGMEKEIKHQQMVNKSLHTNHYEDPTECKDCNV